uniref:Bone morphogenetic protein Bmp5-8 n=1 Tax=Xenoturbella bocki TaxID=242395 RepID=A0A2P1DV41_XENBC|nr:bone morphogenetic protein Bmp5-8 [Xenoturbella bocki]
MKLRFATIFFVVVAAIAVVDDATGFPGEDGDDGDYLAEQGHSLADAPAREHRKLQKEILALLGLRKRPNPSSFERHNSAPLFMMDLYQSIMHGDDGGASASSNRTSGDLMTDFSLLVHRNQTITDPEVVDEADMIMSFPNQARNEDRNNGRQRNHERFHFNINEVPNGREFVSKSELRVFKLPTGLCDDNCTFIISVYQVLKADRQKYLVYLDSMHVSSDYMGWLVFDVTAVINDWLLYPQTNHGFQMDAVAVESDERYNPLEVGVVGVEGYEDQQAFMVAFFNMDRQLHIRRTRAAMGPATDTNTYSNTYNDRTASDEDYWYGSYDTNTYSSRRSCQKRSLYVSFKDLGWQDFIIAPDGYAAYYCRGECSFPLNPHMNATNHAIVQTLVHLMYSDTIPKPCCTPTKLSAISVLYYGKNSNVILQKYRNMVVRSCGCH